MLTKNAGRNKSYTGRRTEDDILYLLTNERSKGMKRRGPLMFEASKEEVEKAMEIINKNFEAITNAIDEDEKIRILRTLLMENID